MCVFVHGEKCTCMSQIWQGLLQLQNVFQMLGTYFVNGMFKGKMYH